MTPTRRRNQITPSKQKVMSDKPLIPRSRTTDYEESLKSLPWQSDNNYIRHGYRRQLHTFSACLKSAFTYVHNETVNIHSHLLGAVFFASLIPLHLYPTHFPSFTYHKPDIDPLPIPPTLHDKVALTINLLSAATCLGLSSWFHTVCCHSRNVCETAHRGDYIGIVILIVGSITPSMYYAFHDDHSLQIFYMTAILAAGISAAYAVLSPHQRAHRWHRTLVFIALGLSAVIPVVHVTYSKGITYARQNISLDLVVAGGAAYIFGALLYAARIPEKLSPGTFDYFGSSHQIFHCFVLVGAGCMYAGLRGMVWGRSQAVGNAS